jgi:hypothetical protein
MPIQKFRSIADVPAPPRRLPGDPALYRAIASVWEMGRRLRPARRFPAGVHLHRSVEAMNRQRAEWDAVYHRRVREGGQ